MEVQMSLNNLSIDSFFAFLITFILLGTAVVAVFIFTGVTHRYNKANHTNLEMSLEALGYMQDQRTGLCFAANIRRIVSEVPCTPEVLEIIEQEG